MAEQESEKKTDKPISVRRATQEDLRFVCATWFESNWKTITKFMTFPQFPDYKIGMNKRQERILRDSITAIAYATAVPDEIIGYAITEKNILHFVYVKSVYRRQGIATALVGDDKKWFTHLPGKTGELFFAKLPSMHFNPFLLDKI